MTKLVVPYLARGAFQPFHSRTERFAQLVCHRRSGKTTALLADGVKRALEGPDEGRYAYIAPYYGQAKAIAWDILRYQTQDVITRTSEVELWVQLINGSRIRLFGAERGDALRGLKLHGLMNDEYAEWSPAVYEEVLRPMLADTGGWATFAGTPKGRNHFHDQRVHAVTSDKWFDMLLKASESGLIPAEELEAARQQMSPEVYAQEFECSFVAPRSGSIYGELMERALAESRVGNYPHDPEQPVHAACDLGHTDATAFWFWQERPGGWAMIDYEEFAQRPLDWWISLLRAKGYEYEKIWLPHDARAKNLQTGRSTVEQMLTAQLPVQIGPQHKLQHGLDAVRMMLPSWYFNEATTGLGIKRLSNYRFKWDQARNVYSIKPLHDENSDGADAARYAALVMKTTPAREIEMRPVTTGNDNTFQLEVLFEDRESRRPRGVSGMRNR